MAFAFRIIRFLLIFSVYAGLACLVLYVLSNAIQLVGNYFGYELGSLWGWFKDHLPRFPRRGRLRGRRPKEKI